MAQSPLYDIFDPGGELRRRAQLGLLDDEEDREYLGVIPIGNRKPQLSDLMPQEEQRSFLRKLSEMGTSGLAGLGWILDTPGAVVRGTLSGGPGKGISALWETSDDRVTGRELARQYGLAGSEDNWGNFFGGLAAEVLLDPTTYFSLGLNQVVGRGAKTAAGQAAQKAGLLTDFDLFAKNVKNMGSREAMRKSSAKELLENIADPAVRAEKERYFRQFSNDLDAPLARMNRVGIPGMQQGAVDFFGESAGDAAARFGDWAAEGLMTNAYTGPAARGLTAAFDPDVLGRTDYDQQWDARQITAARRAREATDRKSLAKIQYDAEQALRQAKRSLNDQDISEAIRYYAETGETPAALSEVFDLPEMRNVLAHVDGVRNQAMRNAEALGMSLKEYQSRAGTGFFPRQQLGFDVPELPKYPEGSIPQERLKRVRRRGKKAVDVSDTMGARRDYLDVTGGTETINRMSLDADLQQRLRAATPAEARGILEDWAARNNDGKGLYDWMDEFDPEAIPPADVNAFGRRTQAYDDAREEVISSIKGWDSLGAADRAALEPMIEDIAKKRSTRVGPATGEFTFTPPPLGADHPLVKQREALKADAARAAAGGQDDLAASLRAQLDDIEAQIPDATREAYKDKLNQDLGDLMRSLDPQHAKTGRPLFGQNAFNEIANYGLRRGAAESDAQQALRLLKKSMERQAAENTVGGVNYTAQDALKKLGLSGDTAESVLAKELGVDSLADISFNKKFIDDWSQVIDPGRLPPELSPLMEKYDDFTKSFKTLALLFPSRYTRDTYSGAFSAASKGLYSWGDRSAAGAMRKGNYAPLLRRLKDAPGYSELSDEGKIRKFLTEAGGQNLSQSTYADEVGDMAAGAQMREMFPGAAGPSRPSWSQLFGRAKLNRGWNPLNSDYSPFAVRTGSGNRNPFLELGDRAAETTDAWNRYGTYLTAIRKGMHPEEARRLADLTQVNYRPEAFTSFERNVMKRAMPFYSYTRGIIPYIADQVLNQPAGLMGQATRAINRASDTQEESFAPEDLRQTVSIALPESLGGKPADNLQRFLTNIDLPFADPVNLISPGVGNTVVDRVLSGTGKTAMNVLGMINPIPKSILELLTNRQFYTGRELSDTYSFLEQPFSEYGLGSLARVAEQGIYNAPGGSRALGLYRQIADDRTSGLDKWGKIAVNTLAGVKFKDVDQERTRRLAARNMLNQLLETTPGVRTYENITVPDDVLARLPEEQKKQYLLYRIIQSEAAKRAREKKKAEAALDPLQVLGVVNRF